MSFNHKQLTDLLFAKTDFIVSGKTCHLHGKRTTIAHLLPKLQEFYNQQMLEDPALYEIREQMPSLLPLVLQEIELRGKVDDDEFELPFEVTSEDQQDLDEIKFGHKPVVDLQSGDMRIMLNDGSQVASPINIEIYKNQFSAKQWNMVKAKTPVHIFTYDVTEDFEKSQEVATKQGLKTYPTCNLYVPPRWTFQENKGEALHEDHKKIIETRFADVESLERFFCVLFHTITTRSRVICGLVHPRQGTGKSIVNGRIPSYLVGVENHAYTDKGFMADKHKDILLNKRAVFLDEHKLTKGQEAQEKQFVEDIIYIRPLGKPAVSIPNNLSFFMNSNNYEDIYTPPSARRHYFLEDSGRHIVEEFGREFVDTYLRRMGSDDEFVANLGYYILNEFAEPKYGADAIYKGPTFEKVVRSTCFPGYESIVEELESGEVVDGILYSDAKKKYRVQNRNSGKQEFYPRMDSFKDFFRDFRWKGKPICRVETVDKYDIKLVPVDN